MLLEDRACFRLERILVRKDGRAFRQWSDPDLPHSASWRR